MNSDIIESYHNEDYHRQHMQAYLRNCWEYYMGYKMHKHMQGARESYKGYALTYQLLKSVVNRINNEYDCITAVTGNRGNGKSASSIYLALVLSELLGSKFTIEDNVIFTYNLKEAADRILNSRKQVFVIDEGIDATAAQDSSTKAYKELVKVFIKIRKFNNIYFINIPKFWMFGKMYRGDLIHYRIDIFLRNASKRYAQAGFFAPDKNPNNPDPWFLGYDERESRKKRKSEGNKEYISSISSHPTFKTYMKIPKLADDLFEKYRFLSENSLSVTNEKIKKLNYETSTWQVKHRGKD